MIELIQFALRKKNPSVRRIRGNDLPEGLFNECAARWPKFVNQNAFKYEGASDSSEVDAILKLLKKNGYEANWKSFPRVGYRESNRFQLEGKRVIERKDIEAAKFLVAVPQNEIAESAKHLGGGELFIESKSLVGSQSFGRASGSRYLLCTKEIRNLLEADSLNTIMFDKVQESRADSQLFRIGGSNKMPPTSSNIVDLEGMPYSEESDACQIDDLYTPPILRYQREQIEALEGNDILFTDEHFGAGCRTSWEPNTIVSQRFRLLAEKYQLLIDYIPVQVEDSIT